MAQRTSVTHLNIDDSRTIDGSSDPQNAFFTAHRNLCVERVRDGRQWNVTRNDRRAAPVDVWLRLDSDAARRDPSPDRYRSERPHRPIDVASAFRPTRATSNEFPTGTACTQRWDPSGHPQQNDVSAKRKVLGSDGRVARFSIEKCLMVSQFPTLCVNMLEYRPFPFPACLTHQHVSLSQGVSCLLLQLQCFPKSFAAAYGVRVWMYPGTSHCWLSDHHRLSAGYPMIMFARLQMLSLLSTAVPQSVFCVCRCKC